MSIVSGYGLPALNETLNYNFFKTQNRLLADVSHLSSGLRIQSAADDPSGLAIAEKLSAQINGHDQAVSNVQDAMNALTVADGALQTVTDLLQRLRSLYVAANNDLLGANDRKNIQTETAQLCTQINTIAGDTTFNAVQLFSDPHAVQPIIQNGTFLQPPTTTSVIPLSGCAWTLQPPNAFGTSQIGSVAYYQSIDNIFPPPSDSTQILQLDRQGADIVTQTIPNFSSGVQYTISFNVTQVINNANAGRAQQAISVTVDGSQIALVNPLPPDPSQPAWTTVTTPAFVVNGGSHTVGLQGLNVGIAYVDDVQVNTIPSTAETIAMIAQDSTLTIHDGANEGNAARVKQATLDCANLGIAAGSASTSATAQTSETNVGYALDYVDMSRALLGAQMVRLQYQADNSNTAALNLTGAESNIRDTNIAQITTAFARDQILSSIGQSILDNTKVLATQVEKLFG